MKRRVLFCLSALTTMAQAGVLDFANATPPVVDASSTQISQSYGDVAGLVDVSYAHVAPGGVVDSGLAWWGTGYDDLAGVAWNGSSEGGDLGRVTLASIGGNPVRLDAFDLGIWQGGRGVPETVVVFEIGQAAPVFAATLSDTGTHWSFAPQLSSTSGFVIEWTSPWWVAIDNIDSSAMPVPEPGRDALLLLGLATIGLAAYRRR